jgi:DNA-binding NarL/FixJ family response regulator
MERHQIARPGAPRPGAPPSGARRRAATIHVFVADEHAIVREGLRRLLSDTADLVVVGEAESGEEVLRCAAAETWDVLLTGLLFADLDGVVLLGRLRALRPELRVVVFTSWSEAEHAQRALDAGAAAFLNKRRPVSMVVDAIREATAGRTHRGPEPAVPGGEAHGRTDDALRVRARVLATRWGLTKRQTEVLELLAHGSGNKDIAALLGCAEVTVEFHVTALLKKAGAVGRAGMIARFWSEKVPGA